MQICEKGFDRFNLADPNEQSMIGGDVDSRRYFKVFGSQIANGAFRVQACGATHLHQTRNGFVNLEGANYEIYSNFEITTSSRRKK